MGFRRIRFIFNSSSKCGLDMIHK